MIRLTVENVCGVSTVLEGQTIQQLKDDFDFVLGFLVENEARSLKTVIKQTVSDFNDPEFMECNVGKSLPELLDHDLAAGWDQKATSHCLQSAIKVLDNLVSDQSRGRRLRRLW